MYRWAYTETGSREKRETPKKLDPDVWWPHLQSTKSSTEKRNRIELRERGSSLIGPFCADVEKLILIKSKIKNCHSINALCNEIRKASIELDEYACINGQTKLRKAKSTDCVDHAQVRRIFDELSTDGRDGNSKETCDIIENSGTKNEGTQTDDPIEMAKASGVRAMDTQSSVDHCAPPPPPPPPPPPMPNANRSSLPPPPPPPMPQHQTAFGNCQPQPPPPPPPPPMPTTKHASTVLSSSSSGFCPPPPPHMPNGTPAPLPMPADGNAWFEINSE